MIYIGPDKEIIIFERKIAIKFFFITLNMYFG